MKRCLGLGRSLELVVPARRSGRSAAGTETEHDSESDESSVRKPAAGGSTTPKHPRSRPGSQCIRACGSQIVSIPKTHN